jgi:hypothetical protein
MQETATAHVDRENPPKPLRLWPWVIFASLVCAFGLWLAIWLSVRQANQLIAFARENGGTPWISYKHPGWLSGFVSKTTFLPWYDRLDAYHLSNVPIPERQLRRLQRFRELKEVTLDISSCSPESVDGLAHLENLERITLTGNNAPTTLGWLQNKPKLWLVELSKMSITPDQWQSIYASPLINGLSVGTDNHFYLHEMGHGTGLPRDGNLLELSAENLTQLEAEQMVEIADLKTIMLDYSSATPEFWETLSQHPSLQDLRIKSPGLLSRTELAQIAKIGTLESLRLRGQPELDDEQNVTPAWREFLDQRPDVRIVERFYKNEK